MEHDDLDFFSVLCISSPSLNQLWTLCLHEKTLSSMSHQKPLETRIFQFASRFKIQVDSFLTAFNVLEN